MSAGSAPSLRCGGLDRLDQRWASSSVARPPLIELVEMSAGSAPSLRCGGLARQARPAVGQFRVSSTTAHRACRDVRRVGSQPSLRRSRQVRPAVGQFQRGSTPPLIELVEMSAGSVPSLRCGGLDRLDQRSSSLSRCPPGRLPAFASAVSTGSTSGGPVPAWLDHRSSSLSRCPQGRLPALAAAVSTGSTSGGPVPAWLDHRSSSLSRCPQGQAPSVRCGGSDQGRGSSGGSISGCSGDPPGSSPGPGGGSGVGMGVGSPLGTMSGSDSGSSGLVVMPSRYPIGYRPARERGGQPGDRRRVRAGDRLHPRPDHRRRPDARARADRRPALAGRARPLPARRGAGLPVGQPGDHRARAARAPGRDLAGPLRADPRPAELELRPRPGRAGPGARDRAAAAGVLRALPGVPEGDHRPGDRRRPDRPGGHQRLPLDHPRPVPRVA